VALIPFFLLTNFKSEILTRIPLRFFPRNIRFISFPTVASVSVCLILFALWLLTHQKVNEKRLLMYKPSPETSNSISDVVEIVNSKKGKVILSGVPSQFIVSQLKVPFLIIDQPGIIEPLVNKKSPQSYEQQFAEFIKQNQVKTIISHTIDCNSLKNQKNDNTIETGWGKMADFAYKRHYLTICSMIDSQEWYQVIEDQFLVLIRRD